MHPEVRGLVLQHSAILKHIPDLTRASIFHLFLISFLILHPEVGAIPEGMGDAGPLPGAWAVRDCPFMGGLAASLGGLDRALGGCAAPFSEAATSGALAMGGAAPGVT